MRLEEALAVLDPCRGEACLALSAHGLSGPWGDLDEVISLLSLEGPEGRSPQDLRKDLERLAGAQHRWRRSAPTSRAFGRGDLSAAHVHA
jgi:hypothetical protein